jgi:hypothetical protein
MLCIMMPLPSDERARHYRQEDPVIALVLMSHCGLMFSFHPFSARALDEGSVPPQAHTRLRGGTALSLTQMPALPSRPLGGS